MSANKLTEVELVQVLQTTCQQMLDAGFEIAHIGGNYGLLLAIPKVELVETGEGTEYRYNPEKNFPLVQPETVPESSGNSGTNSKAVPE